MKSIYFITFLFLFSFINSELDLSKCSGSNYHLVDTGNRHYKSEISFDWTKEDEYELNVPFTDLKNENEITPFLINATVVKFSDGNFPTNNIDDYINEKFQGYKFINIIKDEKFTIHKNVLRANIKSTDIKANENKIGDVYKYYFGWLECESSSTKRIRVSNILVSVNNGKFYQISKYLLFVIAGLLL
jgi:hypothetical protein